MALPTPWSDYRAIAENVGQSVADALSATIGSHVELGKGHSCDPEDLLTGRPMPVYATMVRFGRPLRDVMIFISSLKEDVVRPLVEVAARTAIGAMNVPTEGDQHGPLGQFEVDDAIEYETLEEALEECDALYLEAVYSLELPRGELQMVLGTALLESAMFLQRGEVDPFAEGGAAYVPAGATLEAPTELAATTAATAAPGVPAAPVPAAPAASAPSPIESLDGELARLEPAAPVPAGPAAPAAPQPTLADVTANRWTDLLSGVDVELSAELGRADLPLGEITSLDGESVLTLDQMVHEPVTVYVNGTPYATARLVVVDGEYGIEILEVVDQGGLAATLAA